MKKRREIRAGGFSNLALILQMKWVEQDKKGKQLTGLNAISIFLTTLFKANAFYCDEKSNTYRDIINGQLIFQSRNRISKPHVAITVSF